MRRAGFVVAVAVATLLALALPGWSAPTLPRAEQAEADRVDFNGDGFADLAVGAPGEAVGSLVGAGALNVLNGSATGLQPSADVFFQGSGGVAGTAEHDDGFGAAVAKGDFNDDGFFDLAVGAPGEAVGSVTFAGAVNILYGSSGGLAGGPLFTQDNPEPVDSFGASLAAGDFNGDGFFDLAVGVPDETVGPDVASGAVNLLAGSVTGPSGGTLVLQANPEDFDFFGQALAGGFFLHDFDNNGFFDLAVGAPLESAGSRQAVGAVSVFYAFGGAGGTVTPGPVFLQGSGGLGGTAEARDFFGTALE